MAVTFLRDYRSIIYSEAYSVTSASNKNRVYTVAKRHGNGAWECSCPAWVNKHPRQNCKHIREVMTSLEQTRRGTAFGVDNRNSEHSDRVTLRDMGRSMQAFEDAAERIRSIEKAVIEVTNPSAPEIREAILASYWEGISMDDSFTADIEKFGVWAKNEDEGKTGRASLNEDEGKTGRASLIELD